MRRISKYFEDFQIGEQFISPGRTISETDVMFYAWFSGDCNQLHTDEIYCREKSIYKTRVVHGLLGLAVTEGLKSRVGNFEGTSLASLEWSWKHKNPIMIGDTIHVEWTITDKREASKSDRGIVWEGVKLINQRGEIVGEGTHVVMIQRSSSQQQNR